MSLPAYSEYTDGDAVRFYLGDAAEEHGPPDAEFSVEGWGLPVHSSVLKAQSAVMRDVYKDKHLKSAVAAATGLPLPVLLDHATRREVVMSDSLALARPEQSLVGLTLKRVVHFLRFLYHPDEIDSLDIELPGAAKTFSASARLAHQLEMPALLDRFGARIEETVDAHRAPLHRLMDWAQVAEDCGLRRLWTKCVQEIATVLARSGGGCTARSSSSTDLAAKMRAMSVSSGKLSCASSGKASKNGSKSPSSGSSQASSPSRCSGELGGGLPGSGGLRRMDGAQTAAHDVALLKTLSEKAQLAVMSALLAGLRRADCDDPADLLPQEASLGAALPPIWKMRPAPESPRSLVAP